MTKENYGNNLRQEVDDKNIDCIYNKDGDRDACDLCGFPLLLNDVHYLTCSNTKCGIMYKDRLDFNAEWRYYGADDNNSSDPNTMWITCKSSCYNNLHLDVR